MNDEWCGEMTSNLRPDPNCYRCHGTGVFQVSVQGGDDFVDEPCDCEVEDDE